MRFAQGRESRRLLIRARYAACRASDAMMRLRGDARALRHFDTLFDADRLSASSFFFPAADDAQRCVYARNDVARRHARCHYTHAECLMRERHDMMLPSATRRHGCRLHCSHDERQPKCAQRGSTLYHDTAAMPAA